MFTKVNFDNNEVKRIFKSVLKEEQFLGNIIGYLGTEYKEMVIKNIIINHDELQIAMLCDNSNVSINVDFSKNQTLVVSPNVPYSLIFSNYVTGMCIPKGKLYQNEDRSIVNKSVKYINSSYAKIRMYDLIVSNNTYGIIINEFKEKINEKEMINELLDTKNEISNINDILNVLKGVVDISNLEIKINTFGDKADVLILDHGILTKYLYHRENKDYKEKIYLENNKFYVEKTTKEKLEEDLPFVKKIGVMK